MVRKDNKEKKFHRSLEEALQQARMTGNAVMIARAAAAAESAGIRVGELKLDLSPAALWGAEEAERLSHRAQEFASNAGRSFSQDVVVSMELSTSREAAGALLAFLESRQPPSAEIGRMRVELSSFDNVFVHNLEAFSAADETLRSLAAGSRRPSWASWASRRLARAVAEARATDRRELPAWRALAAQIEPEPPLPRPRQIERPDPTRPRARSERPGRPARKGARAHSRRKK